MLARPPLESLEDCREEGRKDRRSGESITCKLNTQFIDSLAVVQFEILISAFLLPALPFDAHMFLWWPWSFVKNFDAVKEALGASAAIQNVKRRGGDTGAATAAKMLSQPTLC